MSPTTATERITAPRPAPQAANVPSRLGALDILILAAWCGLAAGLLEVGTRVLCRAINPVHRLYLMSRHFVWLTPLVNLLLFLGLGFCLAALTRVWPRFGGKIGPRLICAFAVLPMLMVASPYIFPEAWFMLALGVASWLVPSLERRQSLRWRRLVQIASLAKWRSLIGQAPYLVAIGSKSAAKRPGLSRRLARPMSSSSCSIRCGPIA